MGNRHSHGGKQQPYAGNFIVRLLCNEYSSPFYGIVVFLSKRSACSVMKRLIGGICEYPLWFDQRRQSHVLRIIDYLGNVGNSRLENVLSYDPRRNDMNFMRVLNTVPADMSVKSFVILSSLFRSLPFYLSQVVFIAIFCFAIEIRYAASNMKCEFLPSSQRIETFHVRKKSRNCDKGKTSTSEVLESTTEAIVALQKKHLKSVVLCWEISKYFGGIPFMM